MKQEEAHLHDDVTFELLHVHNLVDKLDDVFAPQRSQDPPVPCRTSVYVAGMVVQQVSLVRFGCNPRE